MKGALSEALSEVSPLFDEHAAAISERERMVGRMYLMLLVELCTKLVKNII